MDTLDWDDPAVEEHWCGECRRTVTEYLAKQSLDHGEVGSWPAWHVVPYVSIWAVESLLAFADIWKEVAECMVKGVPHPSTRIGPSEPNPELTSLLENRSGLLRRFAEDDSLWGAEYD